MILDIVKGVLDVAGKLIGGSTGQKMSEVSGELANAVANNSELQKEVMNKEIEFKKMVVADTADARQLIREQSLSNDPYVRRARPTFLWLVYVIMGFNFIILPVLQLITGKVVQPIVLPEEVYLLFGTGFLGYSAFRTWDKKTMINGKS